MNKPTILHITSGHVAFDDRIFFKEAISLSKKYNVIILSPGINNHNLDLSGKEKKEGIYEGILCLTYDVFPRKNLVIRILKFFLRIIGIYKIIVNKMILKKITEKKIHSSIIHIHEPDLFFIATKLKRKFKSKLIFDAHEMFVVYPLDRYKFPISHFLTYFKLLKYKKYFKEFDATIAVNILIKTFNVVFNPYIKNEIIYNASLFKVEPCKNEESLNNKKIVLVHEGSLKFNRGFEFMCDLFKDKWTQKNVVLHIIGEITGKEKKYFEKRMKYEPWLKETIKPTGWKSYLDVPVYLKGDIGLILLTPLYNNLVATPNKFFNYINAELPIISFDIPVITEFINNYDVGVVSERNVGSLKEKIKYLYKNLAKYKQNVKKVKGKLSWDSEEKKLLALYEKVLNE
jgi:glycosyltransferase involved in cell wall biosynthesis